MRRSWFFGVVSLVLLTILFALVCSSCGKSAVTPDGAPESGTEEQSGLVYEYITEDGKTVGRVGYDANGALVFREDYDFLGRVVKTSSFNTDGTEASVTEYVFLDGGNIPDHYTSTRYEYSGGALSGYSVASYHMEGIPDSVYEYGAEDELLGATLYVYNEAGVVISETHINSKN
ncbi:MAG: hypothetical protein IJQ80_06570, partial [Clostridia bacterium]|nr:hypothetical protein [Clostridia bacterium]